MGVPWLRYAPPDKPRAKLANGTIQNMARVMRKPPKKDTSHGQSTCFAERKLAPCPSTGHRQLDISTNLHTKGSLTNHLPQMWPWLSSTSTKLPKSGGAQTSLKAMRDLPGVQSDVHWKKFAEFLEHRWIPLGKVPRILENTSQW